MADLLTAIQTLSSKLIPNSTGEKRRTYVVRLADYSHRLMFSEVPQLMVERDADEPDEPLSRNASVATQQILARYGFETKFDEDGQALPYERGALLKAASPEDIRVLALLGQFGAPGTEPGVDYSLYTQYYHQVGSNWQPNQPPDDDTWAPWTAYLDSL